MVSGSFGNRFLHNVAGAILADYGWNIKDGVTFAMFGGICNHDNMNGVLYSHLAFVISLPSVNVGANINSVTMDGSLNKPPALVHMEAILAKKNLMEYLHPHQLTV